MKEIWKKAILDDIELDYYVSNLGRIKNLNGKILKLRKNNKGYWIVDIYINKKKFTKLIHRIIGCTFIPNLNFKRVVNHKDGDKNNNTVDNLEWTTYSENNKHAYDHKLKKKKIGEDAASAKATADIVIEICKMLEYEPSVQIICEKLGVNRNLVNSIRDGRAWSYISKNYKFLRAKYRTNKALKQIIRDMYNEGFSEVGICDLLGWPRENKYFRRIRKALL